MIKQFGTSNGLSIQPDRVITERTDGMLEATVVFKGKSEFKNSVKVGDRHPDDNRLRLFDLSTSFSSLSLVIITASYVGLIESPTRPIATYSGGSSQEPIETHPNFRNFAGDPHALEGEDGYLTEFIQQGDVVVTWLAGKNGASFNPQDRSFQGFTDPKNPLAGTRSYLKVGDQVSVTYYTDRIPDFSRRGKVFDSFPHRSIAVNNRVKNWLLIEMPIAQVGTDDPLYKVTELYLGSDEEEGWHPDVYQSGDTAFNRFSVF